MLTKTDEDYRDQLDFTLSDVCAQLIVDVRSGHPDADISALGRARDRLLAAISKAMMDAPDDRTDAHGRARAGSQLQTQLFVNRFQDEFNRAILDQLPDLAATAPTIQWISPLSSEGYGEYRDREFLGKVGLESLVPDLLQFWPARGPRWDALAVLRFEGEKPGVLLVEAKAHTAEILGSGCGAGGDRRALIQRRLNEFAARLGMARLPDSWLEAYYQAANRIAHLMFLRDCGVDAWLANVYFVDDWHRPTAETEWLDAIRAGKAAMEVEGRHIAHVADVIVAAKKLTPLSLPTSELPGQR